MKTLHAAIWVSALAQVASAEEPHAAYVKRAAEESRWLMSAKDYAGTRFSTMKDIDVRTVKNLKVAWQFDTGVRRGQEAAPLVDDGTLYVVTPYPNRLHALDLTRPGAPLKWTYDPKPAPAAQGVACCDVVNRGAAIWNGRVYYNTLDNHTVAIDAKTGAEVWKVRLGDVNRGETMTMAPLVVKGRVLVGNSGGELGVRGWLTALDADTGKILWRAWSTGPDKDCLIGPGFKPFYEMDRGRDLGVTSWPPDKWRIGGGTVWGFVSYDPDLDLIYYGTANPGPWNPNQRPGDNKWTAGMFARRPGGGEAVWFYQWSPHDQYDHDGVNEAILVDLEIGGRSRKVLLHPDRNGYLYVVDRQTGEVISADAFHPITVFKGVDLKSGRLIPVPEKAIAVQRVVRGICPSATGAKDWQPAAWSPATRLLYMPHNNLCQDEEGYEANYIAGTPYLGANVRMYFAEGDHGGFFTAWDPVARKKRFALPEKFPVWSGALATAGNVVFYGTMDGWFKAIHAETGELLWKHQVDSGIIGQPITYRGPDGKQYVSVLSGVGGWAGVIVAAGLDPRDQTAALGFANAMKDLPNHTRRGGTLYTFALP
jgi:lanthanide-dependent methanol dehydrogenase